MRIPWDKLWRRDADDRSALSPEHAKVSPDSPFLPLFGDETAAGESNAPEPFRQDQQPDIGAGQPGSDAETPGSAAPRVPATPQRPRRRGLIPRWLPWAAGGTVAALLLIVLAVLLLARADRVRVPSLEGLDRATATKRIQGLGLRLVVGDRRFSGSVPAGSIIDQRPVAGSVVEEGSIVRVAISAGSEVFGMPDVLGEDLDTARGRLRDRGLAVEFETAPSDAEQGTVIASVPSPGADVRTGDTVRLTVAAGVSTTDALLPSDLTGVTIVLDPEPMPAGSTSDITLDMARRVRALLEASGARVAVTRSVTDSARDATSLLRLRRAREASATALVGLTVGSTGTEGLQVSAVPDTATAVPGRASSSALAQGMAQSLREGYPDVPAPGIANDAVLGGVGIPAARVRLGTTQSSADRLAFMDPQWAERVARAIYTALAKAYGGR